jgi:hypothetical protein
VGVKELLDGNVRRKLEDSFGPAVAMMILASAHSASRVPVGLRDEDDFLRLCDAICADSRVVGMWGKAGAEQALRQWRGLV